MTEVHRVTDTNTAGAAVTSSLQGTVYAGNPPKLIAVDGSPVAGHGTGLHAAPVTANGDTTVLINSIPVNSKGDADSCGHARDTGLSTVFIGPTSAPAIVLTPEQEDAVAAEIEEAVNNPPDVGDSGGTQANGSGYAGQVPQVYEGAPAGGVDTLGTTTPLVDSDIAASTAAADGIPGFLGQVLTEANNQLWDENGSNPNIINIWKELGFPDQAYWRTDSTPWCAGFANWVLKRTGYKYMQSARAYDFRDKTSIYGGVPVPLTDGQPGDIVVWDYSHVNFIYTVPSPGVYTFVGGNQSDRASANNNPSDGSVTNSWPGGWTQSNGRISGIFRPVRG